MKAAWPIRFLGGIASFLLVLFGIGTLGSFIPSIPVLGVLGSILIGGFGPWMVLLSFAGAIWAGLRWRKTRRKRTLFVAAMAAFTAFGITYVQALQISVASAKGVRINLAQTFLAGSQTDNSLKPVTVNYTTFEGAPVPLDIYRPLTKQGSGPAPIFVYVHGGGWVSQTLKQRQADFRWFAERGYLVISLEYTLSSEKRHTWNIAEPQLGCALAWVNANATRYGGDVSRLALWGESAGGNLVLNLSYRANQGTLAPSCAGTLPRVDATIALYPVVDPARMYRPVDSTLGVFGRMMGDNYTGGSPEKFPDRYKAIASSTHINAKAPATLLIIPQADHLVDPHAAYDFEKKTRVAGVKTRLIRMPYAEHSFDLRNGSIGNQLVRRSMLKFLKKNGLEP